MAVFPEAMIPMSGVSAESSSLAKQKGERDQEPPAQHKGIVPWPKRAIISCGY